MLKVASHIIQLRLTNRLITNGSFHTGSVGHIRLNFLVSNSLLKIGLSKLGCRWWCSCCMYEDWRWP